jgi:multidrug efflux pump subunit AcrB
MTVVTAWPGATAQEMQDQVAEPLEKRLQELKWYDRTETFTRPGLAFTTLTLKDPIPPKAVQEEFYQARKKLGDEAANLPRGVLGPVRQRRVRRRHLRALRAEGQGRAAPPAGARGRDPAPAPAARARRQEGQHHRRAPERIFVEFSQARLATLGVSPQDIFAALNNGRTSSRRPARSRPTGRRSSSAWTAR